MGEFYNWCVEQAYPSIMDFILPLMPWMGLSFVATLLDLKLSYELYSNDHKNNIKPKISRYVNKIINCILLVLLAGFCRLTVGVELGVTIVSTVVLIAFACLEVTKCFNKFMQIENTGKKINLLNLFKGTHTHSVIELDNDLEQKTEEDGN